MEAKRAGFMRRVITSEAGGELYAKRQCMVEPVFAQIKANRRIERQTKRPGGRTLGMAPDCGHSQPSEAPPTLPGGRNSLIGVERPCRFQLASILTAPSRRSARLRDTLAWTRQRSGP
jgi:hypothetical protein